MSSQADKRHAEDLRRDAQIKQWKAKARQAVKSRQGRKLYVITLHPDVLEREEFRHANPGYVEGMPCLYVGMTIHEPGERYRQHKTGYRSSRYPRRYGVELALDVMDGFDATAFDKAQREAALADWLRSQGYAVWQN